MFETKAKATLRGGRVAVERDHARPSVRPSELRSTLGGGRAGAGGGGAAAGAMRSGRRRAAPASALASYWPGREAERCRSACPRRSGRRSRARPGRSSAEEQLVAASSAAVQRDSPVVSLKPSAHSPLEPLGDVVECPRARDAAFRTASARGSAAVRAAREREHRGDDRRGERGAAVGAPVRQRFHALPLLRVSRFAEFARGVGVADHDARCRGRRRRRRRRPRVGDPQPTEPQSAAACCQARRGEAACCSRRRPRRAVPDRLARPVRRPRPSGAGACRRPRRRAGRRRGTR